MVDLTGEAGSADAADDAAFELDAASAAVFRAASPGGFRPPLGS